MRISKAFAVSISALALVAGAIAPAAHAADAQVTGTQWALGLAPEETGSPGIAASYIRMWDMKTAWRDLNPAAGVWDWSVMDQRISQIERAGAKPLFVLGLTPRWAASSDAGDPRWGAGTASPPADFTTFNSYVTEVMKRYGGRIGAVETWNEANLQTFWAGTPDQMADLTERAKAIIKTYSPGTVVLAASTTTRLAGATKNVFGPYAAALKKRGYPFDAWAIHSYPAASGGPAARYADITSWQKVLGDATQNDPAANAKQIWDTEINYGLAGPGGSNPDRDIDNATGAAYIARTYIDSIRVGIDSTAWYLWTVGNYGLIGVQTYAGTTPTIDAYNRSRNWTNGATFKGCNEADGVLRCFFSKGDPFFVAMSKDDSPVTYSKAAALPAETWAGQTLAAAGTLSLGTGPVKFTCPTADKSLCTFGVSSANTENSTGTGTNAKAITVTGKRELVRGKNGITVSGSTSLGQGTEVKVFYKLGRIKKYSSGGSVFVDANGQFIWQKVTSKETSVYVTGGDLKSTSIRIPGKR